MESQFLPAPEDNLHQSLIALMLALHYRVFKDGVCEGAAIMAMQTFFATRGKKERLSPLLNRLEYLHTLKMKFGTEKAAKYLMTIREGSKGKNILSEEEQLIVDCFAMMDGILLHLRPDLFPELFQRQVVQGETDTIMGFTSSIALEKQGLPSQAASFINMFNDDEFKNYLDRFNQALTVLGEDVVLILQTASHTIDLMYEAETKRYTIFDITHCESKDFLNLPFDVDNLPSILLLLMSDDEDKDLDDKLLDENNLDQELDLPTEPESSSMPMQIAVHLSPTKKNLGEIFNQYHLSSSINELLDKGTQVGPNNATLAYIAAQNGKVELLRALIKRNIDVDIALKTDGSTIAYIATCNNHADIIKELTNANMNAATKAGIRPAFVAAQYNYCEVLIALKTAGANLDLKNQNDLGSTPLMAAAKNNSLEALKTLIALGVNLDTLDNNGLSALYHAVANNQTEAALLLIQNGARLDLGDAERLTPLLLAATHHNQVIVEACLNKGADLLSHSKNHKNLAHYAARTNNVALLTILIKAKFPLENKTDSGFTALDLAVFGKNLEAVDIILPHVNPTLETLQKLQTIAKDHAAIVALLDKKIHLYWRCKQTGGYFRSIPCCC